MARIYATPIQEAIFAAMEALGPCTLADVSAYLGKGDLYDSFERLRGRVAMHVVDHKRNLVVRGRWAKVWALGRGADKAPPTQSAVADARRRYAERYRAVILARSRKKGVFPANKYAVILGLTRVRAVTTEEMQDGI